MRYKYYGTLELAKHGQLDKSVRHFLKKLIVDSELIEVVDDNEVIHSIWTTDVNAEISPIFQEHGTYEEITELPEPLKPWILGFR